MARILGDVAISQINSNNDDDRFGSVESKLSKPSISLPNISPAVVPDPQKERRNSSLSMPVYVWDLLADAAHNSREPQNIFVMKALKMAGLPIDVADLVDPRKTRYSK
ncbi:MAG TPA: hypothetical protein PKJ68_05435 [Candidatus Woesebacteria bacterium]|nr:hypothetical protein [Candidatus Woesebacteria bacterium]